MTDASYKDDQLVYIDIQKRSVVGPVEWSDDGSVIPKEMVFIEKDANDNGEEKRPKRKPKKRYYPWGTYKTMKRLYRIEGKQSEVENYIEIDEAIEKSLDEPYWD